MNMFLLTTVPAILFSGSSIAYGDTIFTDSTMNPANYSISTFQSGGGSIVASQTNAAGNPIPALQVITTVGSGAGDFLGLGYFLNPSFVYDPNSEGVIGSITFSEDLNFSVTGAGVFLVAEGTSSIVSQDGNLYIDRFTAPLDAGAWETTSATVLQSNYNLITNLATLTEDPTQHPNFASGQMEFGFISAWSSAGLNANVATELFDNFDVTVHPEAVVTPEPSTFSAMAVALLAVVSASRISKFNGFSYFVWRR
jgi:hypothetical protein